MSIFFLRLRANCCDFVNAKLLRPRNYLSIIIFSQQTSSVKKHFVLQSYSDILQSNLQISLFHNLKVANCISILTSIN